MNNTTAAERFLTATPADRPQAAEDLLIASAECLDTVADLLTGRAEPLSPEQAAAVGRLVKELGALTFSVWHEAARTPPPATATH
ncbi:MAG: hypothetical protein ACK4UT_00805 [Moraxellaceae bacterium]